MDDEREEEIAGAARRLAPPPDGASAESGEAAPRRVEVGGAPGPEPTRYGDWERGGRCTDF